MSVQKFEKEDLEIVRKEASRSNILVSETPEQRLHVKFIKTTPTVISAVLKHLSYEFGTPFTKPTTKPSEIVLTSNVSVFGIPIPNVKITYFDEKTKEPIGYSITDEQGNAKLMVRSDEPKELSVVSMIGERYPMLDAALSPLADRRRLAFWFVVVIAEPVRDRWARYIGRSINESLPYRFWKEKPRTVLGILGGRTKFADLIATCDARHVTLEIGISAYCDTSDPSPSHDECCENLAWWRVNVYATKNPKEVKEVLLGKDEFLVGGDYINIDYHLEFMFTPDSATFNGRKFIRQRCPQETAQTRPAESE